MNVIKVCLAFVVLVFPSFFCGCGDGGPAAPVGKRVAMFGEITNSGSLSVNGTTFKTANAVLHLPDGGTVRTLENDSVIINEGLLKAGMIVTIKGILFEDGTGVAQEILYKDLLEGQVQSKTSSSMVVMGQTVVPESTAQPDFESLSVGDVVEVSGLFDDLGIIRATYLEKKTYRTDNFELKGLVYSVLSPTSFTLVTGALGSVTTFITINGPLTAGIKAGDWVQVTSDSGPVANVLTARAINIDSSLQFDQIEKAVAEGIVYDPRLQFNSFNLISDMEAPLIQTTSNTLLVDGTIADIVAGRKLLVEFDAVLPVTASRIIFK